MRTASEITAKISALGLSLPPVLVPSARYLSWTLSGNLLFIAGQISQAQAQPAHFGVLCSSGDIALGRMAAASAAMGVLAQLCDALNHTGAIFSKALRLGVFVAASPHFNAHSAVADGASEVLIAVLGSAGQHARTAVGVASLPAGVSVEIDAVIELQVRV
jgi:enamine deaminase RidA (YjgF/YER057c/UK114 family)